MLLDGTANDEAYQRLIDTVFLAQFLLTNAASFIAATNFRDNCIAKFGHTASLSSCPSFRFRICTVAFSGCLAALAFAVCHVVGMGAQKQMVGTNARSVRPVPRWVKSVTIVQHHQTLRDSAKSQFPCNPVSHWRFLSNTYTTVASSLEQAACPNPAPRSFINFQPKSFFQRYSHGNMLTCFNCLTNQTALNSEVLATLLTVKRNATGLGACSIMGLQIGTPQTGFGMPRSRTFARCGSNYYLQIITSNA